MIDLMYKGFSGLPITLIVGLILIGVVGGIYLVSTSSPSVTTQDTTTPPPKSESSPESEWKTYTNKKYGYTIDYPAFWTERSFGDSGTGLGDHTQKDDYSKEFVVVDVMNKPGNYTNVPFKEYVKQAATYEIQNYQDLKTIETVVTKSGTEGYLTTWNVMSLGSGSVTVSNPITYFPAPKNDNSITIQVRLDDLKYLDVYKQMLTTFRYIE